MVFPGERAPAPVADDAPEDELMRLRPIKDPTLHDVLDPLELFLGDQGFMAAFEPLAGGRELHDADVERIARKITAIPCSEAADRLWHLGRAATSHGVNSPARAGASRRDRTPCG